VKCPALLEPPKICASVDDTCSPGSRMKPAFPHAVEPTDDVISFETKDRHAFYPKMMMEAA
jgi:hypothetical protein